MLFGKEAKSKADNNNASGSRNSKREWGESEREKQTKRGLYGGEDTFNTNSTFCSHSLSHCVSFLSLAIPKCVTSHNMLTVLVINKINFGVVSVCH